MLIQFTTEDMFNTVMLFNASMFVGVTTEDNFADTFTIRLMLAGTEPIYLSYSNKDLRDRKHGELMAILTKALGIREASALPPLVE